MTQTLDSATVGLDGVPTKLLIDGEWVAAADGRSLTSVNPATGKELLSVASGGAPDIDRAVAAARRAFAGTWAATTPAQRGRLLWRVGELIRENLDELARLETLDQGKPLPYAQAEIANAADYWEYYAGWCTKISGATHQMSVPGADFLAYTLREPIGVVGLITPWNYPLIIASYKTAAALASGNCVILKPAEQTPLTALRLGELCIEAGIPPGVVNVVPGLGETAGAAIAAHDGIGKISFTGSTEVGKHILTAASGNLKKLTLELGGKNPNIIFADADLGAAIAGSAAGIFYNQGEVCTAASRLYVERACFDEVVEGIIAAARGTVLGDGLDPAAQMGPLISGEHLARVAGHVRASQEDGASVLTGGPHGGPGYFFEPTVITGLRPEMAIVREEVFGPVLVAQAFDDPEEILAAANDTPFGLAAGVWTRDVGRAHRFARALQAGVVWVNTYLAFDPSLPLAPRKQSGWGYDGGAKSVDEYLQEKLVIAAL